MLVDDQVLHRIKAIRDTDRNRYPENWTDTDVLLVWFIRRWFVSPVRFSVHFVQNILSKCVNKCFRIKGVILEVQSVRQHRYSEIQNVCIDDPVSVADKGESSGSMKQMGRCTSGCSLGDGRMFPGRSADSQQCLFKSRMAKNLCLLFS